MTCRILFIGVFLTYLLLILQQQMFVHAVESGGNNYATTGHNKQGRNRMLSRFARPQNQFNKVKPEIFNEFFGDDDDFFELPKRQTSDDYGHMRFGKRGDDQFDDYGHMRFGRGGAEK